MATFVHSDIKADFKLLSAVILRRGTLLLQFSQALEKAAYKPKSCLLQPYMVVELFQVAVLGSCDTWFKGAVDAMLL